MFRKAFAACVAMCALTASTAFACPNFNLRPHFGGIELSAGFQPDPQVRNVTAGGTINLQRCRFNNLYTSGEPLAGFVTERPDFSLAWYGSSPQLTIALERTNADGILLVNAPDGRTWYFDDDYRGLSPAVTIRNPMQGRYDIWIGSYDGSRRNPAQLIITEYNY